MSIDPRAARALRSVRTRIRDVAAAEHALASNTRDSIAAKLRDEHDRLGEVLADAGRALAAARTVYELDLVADEVAVQKRAIANVATEHQAAVDVVDQATAALRATTRQLRTAEKIVELVDHERSKRDARNEQRTTDDLASRSR